MEQEGLHTRRHQADGGKGGVRHGVHSSGFSERQLLECWVPRILSAFSPPFPRFWPPDVGTQAED